jgi:hypothetical protein
MGHKDIFWYVGLPKFQPGFKLRATDEFRMEFGIRLGDLKNKQPTHTGMVRISRRFALDKVNIGI